MLCTLLAAFSFCCNKLYLHKQFIFYLLIFTDFTKICPFPFVFPLFFSFIYYSIFQAIPSNLCSTHYFSLKYPVCKMSQPISHPQSQRSVHSENITSANWFLQTLPILLTTNKWDFRSLQPCVLIPCMDLQAWPIWSANVETL